MSNTLYEYKCNYCLKVSHNTIRSYSYLVRLLNDSQVTLETSYYAHPSKEW